MKSLRVLFSEVVVRVGMPIQRQPLDTIPRIIGHVGPFEQRFDTTATTMDANMLEQKKHAG